MSRDVLSTVAAENGELVGNWSWTVWLLIPLVIVLAAVTAVCLGPGGEPGRTRSTSGGVSRYLTRTAARTTSEVEER